MGSCIIQHTLAALGLHRVLAAQQACCGQQLLIHHMQAVHIQTCLRRQTATKVFYHATHSTPGHCGSGQHQVFVNMSGLVGKHLHEGPHMEGRVAKGP